MRLCFSFISMTFTAVQVISLHQRTSTKWNTNIHDDRQVDVQPSRLTHTTPVHLKMAMTRSTFPCKSICREMERPLTERWRDLFLFNSLRFQSDKRHKPLKGKCELFSESNLIWLWLLQEIDPLWALSVPLRRLDFQSWFLIKSIRKDTMTFSTQFKPNQQSTCRIMKLDCHKYVYRAFSHIHFLWILHRQHKCQARGVHYAIDTRSLYQKAHFL